MSEKNILILSDDFPPYARGGAGMIASLEASGLAKRGYRVVVLTVVHDKAQAGDTLENGVRVVRFYRAPYHERWRAYRSLYSLASVRKVRELLREVQPSIVHIHNVHQYLSYAVCVGARASGARVIHTMHDTLAFYPGKCFPTLRADGSFYYRTSVLQGLRVFGFRYNPFYRVVVRHLLRPLASRIAVSGALAHALQEQGIQHVSVLHNGIATDEWDSSAAERAAFREKYGLVGKKVILFGGRISGAKGGDALLAAFPAVREKVPDAVLLLMGATTPYIEKLQERARLAGLEGALFVTGWLEGAERVAAVGAADLVAVPSVYLDPLPSVVLEAMAAGKSVVGSIYGGTGEMVVDGETGYVLDPSNQALLAERVATILTDDALAKLMGNEARARLEQQFSLERHLDQLEVVFFGTQDAS